MRAGVSISLLLHLAIALLVFFGLPDFFKPEEFETAIPVQVVNISEQTTQTEMPQPTPPTPEPPKPEPPKPEPPKPEPPKPEPPAPQPAPEPAPTPPPPEPVPEPEPIPEPVIAPPEPEPVPEPQPEPEPEVEEAEVTPPPPVPPKKPTPPKKEEVAEEPEPEPEPERTITDVLKDIEKLEEQAPEQETPPAEQPAPTTTSEAPLGTELSTSEIDAIRAQISQCWIVDVGMQGIEDIVVALNVQFNPDGSVYRIDFADPLQIASDQRYRVLAERARAAVQECSPIRVSSNYNSWKNITFRFNPRGMLGL